jgi:hypothetical protein
MIRRPYPRTDRYHQPQRASVRFDRKNLRASALRLTGSGIGAKSFCLVIKLRSRPHITHPLPSGLSRSVRTTGSYTDCRLSSRKGLRFGLVPAVPATLTQEANVSMVPGITSRAEPTNKTFKTTLPAPSNLAIYRPIRNRSRPMNN